MQKTTRTSLLIVSFTIFVFLAVFFYQRYSINAKNSLRELFQNQYRADQHHLDLRNKGFTSIPDICSIITPGQQADDVWSIDLGSNAITSISVDLSCFKNLNELNLSFNQISRIQNISQLAWLNKLDLGNNQIKKIEGLDGTQLERLQDLHLGYNQITTTEGLETLSTLTSLQLQRNALEDISALAALTNLEKLKLEFNKLTTEDVTFIPEKLKKLRVITVAENQVDEKIVSEWNAFTLKNTETGR